MNLLSAKADIYWQSPGIYSGKWLAEHQLVR